MGNQQLYGKYATISVPLSSRHVVGTAFLPYFVPTCCLRPETQASRNLHLLSKVSLSLSSLHRHNPAKAASPPTITRGQAGPTLPRPPGRLLSLRIDGSLGVRDGLQGDRHIAKWGMKVADAILLWFIYYIYRCHSGR